ncbi:MAG: hypothetical protein IPN29_02055 [Saprospiraceae bacterium]|nr:hypothetical protein [Saprospiraceae bacterium]
MARYVAKVTLVISIDMSDDEVVYALVDSFLWPHGDKRVIKRERRLGLKEHVWVCGNLTTTYGSIIMLEDDLVVSPIFMNMQ